MEMGFFIFKTNRRKDAEMKKNLAVANDPTTKFMPRVLHELIDFLLKHTMVSYSD